ncbi:MAG TPA: hypothetical protein VEH84_04235 [Alphaproteobacteria bacterium]|nr:hypothetical protein [Alphaproteobacteria bacterium]
MQFIGALAALLLVLPSLPAFRRYRPALHRSGVVVLGLGIGVAIWLTIAFLLQL